MKWNGKIDGKADKRFYTNVGIKWVTKDFDTMFWWNSKWAIIHMYLMGRQTEISEELNGNKSNMVYQTSLSVLQTLMALAPASSTSSKNVRTPISSQHRKGLEDYRYIRNRTSLMKNQFQDIFCRVSSTINNLISWPTKWLTELITNYKIHKPKPAILHQNNPENTIGAFNLQLENELFFLTSLYKWVQIRKYILQPSNIPNPH